MNTKNLEQQIDNVITDEIKQKIGSVYDSLVVNQPKGKLPENIFQQYFLPFFAGEQAITTESKVMEHWISIAGTPMAEVDIINSSGEVLFAVPSLFDTKIIDTVIKDRKTSLTDIYANSDARSSRIPAEGNAYLVRALNDKAGNIAGGSKIDDANSNRWKDILQRYGKLKVDANSNEATDNTTDDFEY